MNVVKFTDIWEKHRIKFVRDGKVSWEEIWALQGINLGVKKGEVLGVIGENGAGKTTLLKVVAGMFMPDRGEIDVKGKVSSLMELGAGFNLEFTGMENIRLNARVYGIDDKRLDQQIGKILEFADLGRFIDAPIKCYSQGMYMRLAFALAIFVDPDILLVDDILAVGDREAQEKCIKKIFDLKDEGKTIILVSHDMNMVVKLCDRVILLEEGRIKQVGSADIVVSYYLDMIGDRKGIAVLEKAGLRVVFNNGRISVSCGANRVTKGAGAYVVFQDTDIKSLISSFNLSWRIDRLTADKISARGYFYDGRISQSWSIGLQEGGLYWEVDIEKASAREAHIDLMLNHEYGKWVSLEEESGFPAFAYKTSWQDLGIFDCSQGLLGLFPVPGKEDLNSLGVKKDGGDTKIRIFNAGYDQECRIIQYALNQGIKNRFCFQIFSQADKLLEFINHQKQVLHLRKVKEQQLLRAEGKVSYGNIELFIDPIDKAIRLYYKGCEITKDRGVHISFFVDRSWQDAASAEWFIKKSNGSITLTCSWRDFGLSQTWRFTCDQGKLIWQIDSSSQREFTPEIIKYGLLLKDEYRIFFCGHQEGNFPGEFTGWQDMSLENNQARCFGLKSQGRLPAVTLQNRDSFRCVVQKSDVDTSCHSLQLAILHDNIKSGNYSFPIEISILENDSFITEYIQEESQQLLIVQEQERERLLSQRSITSADTRLLVEPENKALRLFFKNIEITKGNGFHNVFYTVNRWFYLGDAQWEIKKEDDSLILKFFWGGVNFNQIWKMYFLGEDLVWQVYCDYSEVYQFEVFNLGMIFRNEYESFFCGNQQGNFPRQFTYWQDVPLENPRASYLGFNKKDDLPAVVLGNQNHLSCTIQNSDSRNACRTVLWNLPGQILNQEQKVIFSTTINLARQATEIKTLTAGDIQENDTKPAQKVRRERNRSRKN